MTASAQPGTTHPFAAGLAAAKANLKPGIGLIAFAVALLLAYDQVPEVQAALDAVGALKVRSGLLFGLVATPVFAGVLPACIERLLRPDEPAPPLGHLLARLGFWSLGGLQVDFFYQAQSAVFGDGRSPSTLAVKTLVDQMLWVPIWATPSAVLFFAWNDRRYGRCSYGLRDVFRSPASFRAWYRRRVFPTVLANNVVWTPAVLVIYSLPPALQLVVMNLILCFWSLMLTLLTRDTA